MVLDHNIYDLSDFKSDHPINKYIEEYKVNKNENKKVIGKMKDEISNSLMVEIIAL